ncbi:MAG: class I SAM-dependent rRNA methyltransferase [Gemmatimonadota bacterium]|nr:MAG: class I SAM-dependent rRNA methyltransferase [Gemmatimonadota bacterium]
MKRVHLKKNEERRIKKGHLWIYSNEISDSLKDYEPGELVDVFDLKSSFVGRGYINPHSLICVRILSLHQEEIDGHFFQRRIQNAFEYRQRLACEREFYRLVFSEGDLLPGLIIDRYEDHFVVQTSTAGMEAQLDLIVEVLDDLFHPEVILVKNDSTPRELENIPLYKKVMKGTLKGPVVVREKDLKLEVDLLEGQKTGLYLDQWENYKRLRKLVAGASVLDCFCYSGAWALHAAHFGADEVTGVDTSEKAIQWADRNAALSDFSDRSTFHAGNAFYTLAHFHKKHRKFECIILDPPAFVKSKSKLTEGLRGYREINRRALNILSPRGILVTCSCSYHVDRGAFLSLIRGAAADVKRKVRLIELRTQAPDHPILLSMPETEYLKCAILEVE